MVGSNRRLEWGCNSVGRASDQHAAEAGLIPQCGKGFFCRSELLVQTHLRVSVHPREQWWIKETLKHPACIVG